MPLVRTNARNRKPTDRPASALTRLYGHARRLFSATLLNGVLGLATFAISAQALGAQSFGRLALAFTFANAVLRLANFQSWQAIIRFTARADAAATIDPSTAAGRLSLFRFGWTLDLCTAAVAAIASILIAPLAASAFDWHPQVTHAAQLYAVALMCSVDGTPTAVLRYFERFDRLALQQIASATLKLLLVLAVALFNGGFWAFLGAWIGGQVAAHVLLNLTAAQTLASHHRLAEWRTCQWRTAVRWPLMRYLLLSNLDGTLRVARELDVQVVALWVDEAAAGVLRVARQLATLVGRLVDAFYEAGYPELARLAAAEDWRAMNRFTLASAGSSAAVATVGLLGFAALGPWFLRHAFGPEFASAYLPTLILLVAMLVWGATQSFSPALMSFGAPGRLLINHGVAALAYLILLATLVPTYGISGAAVALLGLFIVWGSLTALGYQRLLTEAQSSAAGHA